MTPEEIAAKAAADAAAAKATADAKAAEDAKNAGGNEEHKFRRLFEDSEAKRVADATKLKALEDAEQARKDAELSELDREKKARADAEAKTSRLEADRLRRDVADEFNLSKEAREFLPETADPAILRAKAEALAKLAPNPVAAGSTTQPPRGQQPTVAEQIAAAEKAGNRGLSLELKIAAMTKTD